MLRVNDVLFKRGDELLFERLSFVVHPGQRVAVAGRNGAGKSTLFELLLGRLSADSGEVEMPPGWVTGHLQQETEATDRPALEYVIDGHRVLRRIEAAIAACEEPEALAHLHTDYQDAGGYEAQARAGEILAGLGFGPDEMSQPFKDFSGGWRIRLNLARTLMAPCDLLLLDEPTNHLDLEAIVWLENWLKRFDGTVLIVAHDRTFLDACAEHTLFLSNKSGRLYSGNYSSCERQRAEQLEQEIALRARREAEAARIQKFVDRFRAKASKARQVQSRIKALERMQVNATIHMDSPYSVHFNNPEKASNPLFSFRRLDLGYGQAVVLKNVSQSITPGDRIGVLGANGAGKTTLLRALVGELKPLGGELERGQHCQVGYFAQHQLESLDTRNQALATLLKARPNWREQQCRDYLGGWGFPAQMTTRPIATLSGGEKARLVLSLVALEAPAVLVLDEPTNHLDLDMRDALALALQDYEGAVVIVSHDRSLLEKTVDDFWVLKDGALEVYQGDLDDYTSAQDDRPRAKESESGGSRKERRRERAEQRAELKQLRDEVRRLERALDKAASELAAIETRLADKATYESLPAADLDTLLRQAGRLRGDIEHSEQAWLEASEALEQAHAAG